MCRSCQQASCQPACARCSCTRFGASTNKKADLRGILQIGLFAQCVKRGSHGYRQTVNCLGDEMAFDIAGGRCFHALQCAGCSAKNAAVLL